MIRKATITACFVIAVFCALALNAPGFVATVVFGVWELSEIDPPT